MSFSVPAPAKSAPCQGQNITTGTQWAAHFNALGGSGDVKRHGQCGFDLGSGATAAFNATIAAMASISFWLNSLSNELRLATWSNGIGAKLPIEGFFYTSLSGLPIAQRDQKDHWNSTGIKLPVIKLTLPTGSAPARFDYVQGDQAVPPPDTGPLPVPQLKPAVVEATGSGGTLLKLDDFRNLDKVTVRLTGIAKRDTEEKRASGASPLVFAIPAAWIAENQGSPFFINYSVIPRTGDRREFSRYLRLGTNRAHP
ncbi:hypothetical protein GCM10009552_03740 [Rothia nasimurium]|uniref:Uncharacterized protein n=1 Tax=Luteibacter anthropi TaxID=564369 RepID=A0A7X5ZJJ4_9GAMM|nr:hypothetical protein [Luteibacter anthropi]NII07879.1 hypothetical protein [Luteibacter anthropi]